MSTTPPACTRKGCEAKTLHHHFASPETPPERFCSEVWCQTYYTRMPMVAPRAPRPSRKFLAAEVARLSAELADVHDEVADKKDRLARAELQAESDALVIASLGQQIAAKPVVSITLTQPISRVDSTELADKIRRALADLNADVVR